MKKAQMLMVAGVIAGLLGGCLFHSHNRCRTVRECYWDHGRRVCENRCR